MSVSRRCLIRGTDGVARSPTLCLASRPRLTWTLSEHPYSSHHPPPALLTYAFVPFPSILEQLRLIMAQLLNRGAEVSRRGQALHHTISAAKGASRPPSPPSPPLSPLAMPTLGM